MLASTCSTTNTKKRKLRIALALLSASSLGLAGCAGLVSSVKTEPSGGSTPLTISNAAAMSATMTAVQVDWDTSAPATSQVNYGKTAAYGTTSGVNSSMVSSHQVPLASLAPGTTYHFQIQSTDGNGNTATSNDMTFSTLGDTTPPTVAVVSPTTGATVTGSNVIITATASDNVAVASVQFKVDSASVGSPVTAAPYTYTLNSTTLSNGNHSLTAVATDTAGNSATSASVIVAVNNTTKDTTPPTVSLTAPASGATVSNTVTVSANAADNVAVASVQFQLDGANTGSPVTLTPYTYSWDTTKTANGSHTLRAIATDTSGNSTTSTSVTVTVSNTAKDTTPPTVSMTAPANGVTVSNTVTVSANAADNVAVASVQFQLDSANVGSPDTTSPYTYSWDTTKTANGSHTLRAIATDTSGNSTTSTSVTVTVSNSTDTTPPSVPTGLTATAISSSQINLAWNASTDNVGVTGYNVYRAGTKIGSSTTASYSDGGLSASTNYTYTVSAFDAAGNTSAQSTSASATTQASGSGGGGLPSTLGWYQIPNTQMINVCPSGYNCANVIVPWSGGIADTSRNRLIVWGGGHTDYNGNEVYALNLNANPITLTRLNNPSPAASSCVEVQSDGTPPSRHTYDGLAYIAHVDRMMSWVGSMAPTGCATNDTWTLALSNLQWTNQSPAGSYPGPNGGVGASDYDPNSKNVFAFTESYGQFASYNYDTNTWKALSSGQGINNEATAIIDPKRKLFLIFGAGQVMKIDVSGADTSYSLVNLNGTNCSFASAEAPGVAYDSVQDRVVGWSGGNTVYMYDPDTDSCTSATYPNGPGAQQSLGTYGRFRYFPGLNVFAVVNDASQNAYALRLTSGGGTGGGTGPNITNVTSSGLTTSGATINWTTDVAATSQVEYGTTTSYGTLTTLNSNLVTSHSVALTGLTASTLYHYRVHSKNSSGVESISGDAAFQTTGTGDTTPPTVSVTSPSNGATVTGTVSVTATASDNVAVASVQFILDGANLGAAVTSAPYTMSWDTTTATNASHTLSAKATDTSGNVGNSTAISVTVSNSADAALEDFQARCAATGVVICEGWDNASEFGAATGGGGYANGLYPGDDGKLHGTQDTTNKISGAGSLMFTIDQNATPNVTGYWREDFGPLSNLTSFGQNSTFYMQFRWRVDPNMLNFDWSTVSNEGWKVFIAYGPIPGPSCTGDQFVQENTYQRNVATAYTSCGTPGLVTNNGVPPYLLEQGDYNCPYNSNGGYTSNPSCFPYPSNTWMTEYWIVQTGTYGQANSHFTAYIAADGQPLKKWLDLPNFVFNSGGPSTDAMESILLGPYMSGANGSMPNPVAHMWFDELIISTQPIAAPKF